MTGYADSLDRWRFPPGAGDWDDVLRRAGRRGRTARARVLRRLALAVAAALLLAVPAFALVGALGSEALPPGLRLSARLSDDARLELSAPHTFLVRRARGELLPLTFGRLRRDARGGRRLTPRLGTVVAFWRLDAESPARVLELRGRRGAVLARLCAPCTAGASGRVNLRRPNAIAAFNRRVTAVLVLDSRTLRGPLVLERRR
jgi:hypothetical protein